MGHEQSMIVLGNQTLLWVTKPFLISILRNQ